MKLSARGLALLKSFEGCELKSYDDGGGVWTVGYGCTRGVRPGMQISQAMADEMLRQDVEHFEAGVTQAMTGVPVSQDQFDACVCLAFNIGMGRPDGKPPGFLSSTVLKRHRLKNYTGASNAFVLWNKDNGKVIKGLTRRREAEARLYRGRA